MAEQLADKLDWIREETQALKDAGLYRHVRTIESPQDDWFYIDGKRYLNFCSNNYLGLANHPALKEAAKDAVNRFGAGPGAVRVISGTNSLHVQLEQRIAEFKQVEDALFLTSGYNANLGTLEALVGKEDVIFSDELNHASIIDGARLSRARVVRFNHADPADLDAKIQENAGTYRRGLVVTDGVFSMDGDIAPLDQLYEVAERYGLMLMVDDAHGEGVLGRNGRGIVDHFNLHGKVDVEIGTFSKAFGVAGGVAAGKKDVIDWLRQRARTFVFSSAATPADTGACLAAINLVESSPELVDGLWKSAKYFKEHLNAMGFDTGPSQTPIIPVMIGDANTAQEFSRKLFAHRIFATPIAYPIVPKGKARIRVMISAAHREKCLDYGLEGFERIGREMGLIS